jgi:hypothetical protein
LRRVVERSIDPYHAFEIRQRAGRKPRLISSPTPTVMDVQRWVLSRILDRVPPHPASFAYQTGKSIRMRRATSRKPLANKDGPVQLLSHHRRALGRKFWS